MSLDREWFRPATFSLEECTWLLDHLGESPMVATHEALPPNVNADAVRPLIAYVFELDQLQEHKKVVWAGVPRLKEALTTFLREMDRWRDWAKRGAPRFPSQHVWDRFNRAHLHGVGADADEVRHYIDDQGARHALVVRFNAPDTARGAVAVPWAATDDPLKDAPTALIEDEAIGRYECPICHFTQSYAPGVQSKRNMARMRMARHLVEAKTDPDLHRFLKVHEFGG